MTTEPPAATFMSATTSATASTASTPPALGPLSAIAHLLLLLALLLELGQAFLNQRFYLFLILLLELAL